MSISSQDDCGLVLSPTSRHQARFWLRGGESGENRHGPRWAAFGIVPRGLAGPWTSQEREANVRKWVDMGSSTSTKLVPM